MAKFEQGNPWFTIWTEPRKTIRSIVQTDPKYGFVALSVLYGLPLALNLIQSFDLTTIIPVWAAILGALIVCTFLGMAGISIGAWLLQITGRWIGGKGDFQNVRSAVAWANVPNFVTILLWLVLLGVFGTQIFSKHFSEMQFVGYQSGILFLVMLLETIVSIWGFIILLNTLAEVQEFSIWKALLNVIIPFVGLVAITWIIGWAFWGSGAINT